MPPTCRTTLLTVLLLFCIAACPRQRVPEVTPDAATTVRVQNDRFLNFAVYALRGGERLRLGTVGGNQTKVFVIPRTLLLPGSTPLRFEARQIGGRLRPVSEEFTLLSGEQLRLVLSAGPAADLRRGS